VVVRLAATAEIDGLLPAFSCTVSQGMPASTSRATAVASGE
jgi:hypothetical protein